jgi:hypothetical protein
MEVVDPLGDKIMSRQENSSSNNSHVVQNSNAKTNSATPNIVRTSQMFIPSQPDYRTNSYESSVKR